MRQTITRCIRNVHHSGTCLNHGFYHPCQIFIVSTACVFRIELHVLNITLGIFYSSNRTLYNFLTRRIEFVFNVAVARTDACVNALVLGILQCLCCTVNVFSTARVNAQIVGHVTAFDISITELKSPGLEIGKPASITSTPSCSSCLATCIFSTVLSWQPGTCSPSRNVVSKCKVCHSLYYDFVLYYSYILQEPHFCLLR